MLLPKSPYRRPTQAGNIVEYFVIRVESEGFWSRG